MAAAICVHRRVVMRPSSRKKTRRTRTDHGGFIFDGFRDIGGRPQRFGELLEATGKPLDTVIQLGRSTDEALVRTGLRAALSLSANVVKSITTSPSHSQPTANAKKCGASDFQTRADVTRKASG